MRSFFDDYPRFFETSSVGAWPVRLALRHHAIIESNREVLKGARVFDLASHDGRWSFAALKAGAAHVTGIEVRAHLIGAANDTFQAYGVPDTDYAFIQGDLNHALRAPVTCDVALCLGYFYHTLNHLALMEYLASTGARHLILDGMVEPGNADIVRVYAEAVENDANGASNAGIHEGRILVGHPTVKVLLRMLEHHGYRGRVFDWIGLLEARNVAADVTRPHGPSNPVGDYARGARATIIVQRVS
jgi:hypothetical protein